MTMASNSTFMISLAMTMASNSTFNPTTLAFTVLTLPSETCMALDWTDAAPCDGADTVVVVCDVADAGVAVSLAETFAILDVLPLLWLSVQLVLFSGQDER